MKLKSDIVPSSKRGIRQRLAIMTLRMSSDRAGRIRAYVL